MNVSNGGLSFEISGTNQKLINVLNESKKAIRTFSTTAQTGGKGIDKAFEEAASAIDKGFKEIDIIVDTNKAAIQGLQAKYQELGAAAAKAFKEGRDAEYAAITQQQTAIQAEIAQRQQLIEEAGRQADALLAEEQALNKQKEAAEKNAGAQQSLRSQLREVREQLALLEANGQRGTEAFRRLQEEAGRLTNALGDAQTQARIFSHDNRGLQGVINGLQGVAGAFTMAQGAAALFGGENENLQKTMLKVQSLMSITMGLQQVYNTLNKDSAFMLTTVAKAKDLLTAANARLATALGISTAAAQALMATLTLGLSVAITAVIALISKMNNKAAEAKKIQTDLANKVADSVSKPITKIEQLSNQWQALGNNLEEKKRFVEENQSAFNELGVSVSSVAQAENLLVANKQAFIKAQMEKAKSLAYVELASEAYKNYLKKKQEADDAHGKYTPVWNWDKFDWDYRSVSSEKMGEANEYLKKFNEYVAEVNTTTAQAYKTMTDAEILAADNYEAGTVAAFEHLISVKQQLLKQVTNKADYDAGMKDIQALQKQVDAITGGTKKGGGGGGNNKKKTEAELYADELKARKDLYTQYLKWSTSADATVRAAAESEFSAVLAQGTSYLDYLERQRAAIEQKGTKTATDLQKLHLLNNEIALTTKETVLADFDAQLQRELNDCKTIGEMLAVIQRKRDELKNDNSDVDRAEGEMLDTAETDVKAKAKQETEALLEEYAGYLQEKIDFEESYARNRELLAKRVAEATTEAERQVAEAALAALENKRLEYAQRSGSEVYDELLTQFQTYQQQQTEIQKKYAEMRVEAEKQGNYEMIGLINAKEQEELSKLAAQRLMATESWSQLFTDVSRLGTGTINRLLNEINGQKINFSAQFNPADLQAINQQLERARNELEKRNPFLALNQSLKELRAAMNANKLLDSDDPFVKSLEEKKEQYRQYTDAINSDDKALADGAKDAYADLLKEGTSYIDMLRRKIAELQQKKITIGLDVEGEEQLAVLNAALNKETGVTKSVGESIKASFSSIGGSLDFVKGCFDSVVSGIQKMGVAMDEETEAILGDIGGMLEGASQLASGIATGNPLGIIQGSIGFLASTFDLFNSRDRKAEKSIKKHEQAVTKLEHAYSALQHAVDNALGETVYQNQNAMIKNLRQQQKEIDGMINDEISKKKTDWDKVEDYRERYAEAGRQIEDLIKEITESITQTSAGDLANELADALVDAFNSGENAAKAFGDVANNVLANAVKNALKLQFLEKPLQDAIKQLQKDMGFDEEGNGSFDGLTEAEQARFKAAIQAAGANFAEAMKLYEDLFKELDENGDPTTLSGAIKGASQESIDLLAGQTNAVRQNQVMSIQILRDQLQHLSNMDNGIAVIANRLLTIINALSTNDDPLRAEGITD